MDVQKDIFMQGSSYENDYLIRTIGTIGRNADIALTELVANGWDAGASFVKISLPDKTPGLLIIEDDGCGMSKDEFINRWMKLGYDRLQHQGIEVDFPPSRTDWKRKAYGRNGEGRHGLLCFADRYEVTTWKDGTANRFVIATSSEKAPFVIVSSESFPKEGHGTCLSVTVERHLPDAEDMRHILAARFLHDPNFKIIVNDQSVDLFELRGFIEHKEIFVSNSIKLHAYTIDSTKTAHTKQRQGVAFWVNGRLVGEPSWILGQKNIIDGRTLFGKKYTFIFQSDDLSEHVLTDWSGFKHSEQMELVHAGVSNYVREVSRRFNSERISDTKREIFRNNKKQIKELSYLGKIEIESFLNDVMELSPTTNVEFLSPAINALIALEKTRNGKVLLEKLISLNEDDVESLNKILDTWSVGDALIVLEEIDRRIAVIEAIKRLCADTSTSELKTLHPLVTEARWLFGPEFESSEYASNLTLTNALRKLLSTQVSDDDFINPKKRADLIILKDSTLSAVAIENFDDTGLVSIKNILLIELKKGGSIIGRDEMNQADGYVEDLLHCGHIEGGCSISAFVVGHKLDSKLTVKKSIGENNEHTIVATTYERLVRTAEKRMFNLRGKLSNRYEKIQTDSILQQVLDEPEQREMEVA